MVKINLPQLRQPELPSVNSTVVDTFYRPQVRPLNPALRDLSQSLSGVVPSLSKYKLLKEEQSGLLGNKIKWNFTKFLVDKNGKVIDRYAPITKPLSIKNDIETIL